MLPVQGEKVEFLRGLDVFVPDLSSPKPDPGEVRTAGDLQVDSFAEHDHLLIANQSTKVSSDSHKLRPEHYIARGNRTGAVNISDYEIIGVMETPTLARSG